MKKRNKIIYWIATVWLSLGMVSTGIVQLIRMEEEVANFTHLGYPIYLMTIIGIWKLLSVIAILLPRFPVVKEWAYAGFFFTMSAAVLSHIILGDGAGKIFGPALLLLLTVLSWYFRPPARKLIAAHP
jgi:hypothetical protein